MATIQQFTAEFYDLIDDAYQSQIISRPLWEFIRMDPKFPTFYSLPKTHKGTTPLTGRLIVSGAGSLTQNASILIKC